MQLIVIGHTSFSLSSRVEGSELSALAPTYVILLKAEISWSRPVRRSLTTVSGLFPSSFSEGRTSLYRVS